MNERKTLPPWWVITLRWHNQEKPIACLVETLTGTPALFDTHERAELLAKTFKQRGIRFEVAELMFK
jgi:hypothetical protein